MIKLEDHDYLRQKQRIHVFRFEENWTKDPKCEDVVRRNWFGVDTNCIDKLSNVKDVDSEFEEYKTNEIRKEINRGGKLVKK